MAGSAGSPPGSLTVYVCCEDRCRKPVELEATACCYDADHAIDHDAEPVEYVPREQSDALADVILALIGYIRVKEPGLVDVPSVVKARAVLRAYREATVGDGDDGD